MGSPGAWTSGHIQRIFYNLGYRVGTRPFPFLVAPILLTVISAVGLLNFYEENRIWYLYSPTYAPSHYEHAVATEFFQEKGGKFWIEVPVTARDTGNLLRPNYLEAVESLANYLLFNFTVPCNVDDHRICSFDNLCVGKCNDNQVVPIFTLLYRNKTQRNHPNFRLTFPTMHLYNDEYYVGEQFSGVDVDQRTNVINSIRLIVLYFRTDMRSPPVANALTAWELQLLDYVDKFNHPLINISASSDGLISHEVRRNGLACIPYFGLSVTVVLLFSIASNFRRNDINVSVGEAVCGVSGPLLAIGTTYGLVMLLVDFNSIVFIMPFLIIGIGVDDFFIMVHAWRMTSKQQATIAERAGKMMEEAGPSITITSLTNALSFVTGAITPTPAIRIFCLYTTAGVLIDFVYQITFFAACIVFLNLRQAKIGSKAEKIQTVIGKISGHDESQKAITAHSAVPTTNISNQSFVDRLRQKLKSVVKFPAGPEAIPKSIPSNSIGKDKAVHASSTAVSEKYDEKESYFIVNYCNFLAIWPCRLLVYGIVIIYWMSAIYGCSKMQLKMDASNLILGDSPIRSIEWIYSTFTWRQGSLVFVFINNPPDLSKRLNQDRMLTMVDKFERLQYSMGRNSTSIWLRPFLNHAILYESENASSFHHSLYDWLGNDEDGGGRWRNFVHYHANNSTGEVTIDKFFFATGSALGDDVSWTTRTVLQDNWRAVADEYADFNITIFQAYSFYVDQLNSIAGNTLSTVIIALIIMALVCLLLIPNPTSVISATAAMISINVGVFGYLFLWDINLDPITMCTVLMSIGFSVDFTAHISYHFYRNDPSWPNEKRLADALESIGYPMLQAGISTVLGIVPLLMVDSYMVYVFVKTVFLVIALGLIHGLLFLPALLLSIGNLGTCNTAENTTFPSESTTQEKSAIAQLNISDTSSISETSNQLTESVVKSSKKLDARSSSFPILSDSQRSLSGPVLSRRQSL